MSEELSLKSNELQNDLPEDDHGTCKGPPSEIALEQDLLAMEVETLF